MNTTPPPATTATSHNTHPMSPTRPSDTERCGTHGSDTRRRDTGPSDTGHGQPPTRSGTSAPRSGGATRLLVDRAIRATAALTTLGLAGIAAALSYQHLLTLATRHGQTGWRAATFPLSVDGVEVVASLVLLADRRSARRSGWLPWTALATAAIASLFANIAVADPDPIARAIAGWPALALLTAIKLLAGLLDHPVHPPPTSGPHAAPDNAPDADLDTDSDTDSDAVAVNGTADTPPVRLPVDLMRRIPVDPGAYTGWQHAWALLQTPDADKHAIADQLGVSTRHLEFITAAGRAGLLDHPDPPAYRLARQALPTPNGTHPT